VYSCTSGNKTKPHNNEQQQQLLGWEDAGGAPWALHNEPRLGGLCMLHETYVLGGLPLRRMLTGARSLNCSLESRDSLQLSHSRCKYKIVHTMRAPYSTLLVLFMLPVNQQ